MVKMIKGIDVESFKSPVGALEYHGTTAVFCEIDKNPYSWIYQPSPNHKSHRIICTGNFSMLNNDIRKENFFSSNNLNAINNSYYVDNIIIEENEERIIIKAT